MDIILVSVHLAAAFILVTTVLLQAGKGAGMGAAFGGSSGTVFGARGPATLISKVTCGAAVIFMFTSLFLAVKAGGVTRPGSSIMDEYIEDTAPIASPVASPATPPVSVVNPEAGGTESAQPPVEQFSAPDLESSEAGQAAEDLEGASTEVSPAVESSGTQ